jgi:hypothetical protein
VRLLNDFSATLPCVLQYLEDMNDLAVDLKIVSREEREPFQPVPAEQQARERVGKPPPQSEKPGEQRGAAEPSKPNAAEQQTPQRRRTRRELASLAQNPELRGLAKELFGSITDQAASKFIEMAAQDYPELPPDEALRKLDHDLREGPFSGFTFP